MKETIFTIRGREYVAAPDPKRPVMYVTGQFFDKAGDRFLPNIIPLVAAELVKGGFPASPWAGRWFPVQDGVGFDADLTQAWAAARVGFKEVVEADPVCQECHREAATLQRRAWLAARVGVALPQGWYWEAMSEIGERYRARLVDLWADFQYPTKQFLEGRGPERFSGFPDGAYRPGEGGPFEPRAGDLEFVLEQIGRVVADVGRIFNTRVDLSVALYRAEEGEREAG